MKTAFFSSKFLSIFIFFFFLGKNGKTQNNFSFPTENAIWTTTRVTGAIGPTDFCEVFQHFYEGDTILNSKKYAIVKKKWGCHAYCDGSNDVWIPYNVPDQTIGCLRSEGKKVFFKKYFGSDTTETVLYDFDLKLNDSVKIQDNFYKIWALDTLQDGRKSWYIAPIIGNPVPSTWWVEGRGSKDGLFSEFDLSFYSSTCWDFGSNEQPCPLPCTTTSLFSPIKKEENSLFELNPMPFRERFEIIFKDFSKLQQVEIFSADGEPVKVLHNFQKTMEVDTNEWQNGWYFIKTTYFNGHFEVKKIIKN